MGHTLSGVIGPATQVAEFANRWVRARLIHLPQRFALVPLTHALHDDIVELAGLDDEDPFGVFSFLSAGVSEAVRQASRGGYLGYLETDYFGGTGAQCAIAWFDGRICIGPVASQSSAGMADSSRRSASFGAVHQVLVAMGVTTRTGQDAFDALRLGTFRRVE